MAPTRAYGRVALTGGFTRWVGDGWWRIIVWMLAQSKAVGKDEPACDKCVCAGRTVLPCALADQANISTM